MSIQERPPSVPSAGEAGSDSGNRGADGNNPAVPPDARTSPHFQNMWMRFNEAQKAQRNETTLDPADNPARRPEGEAFEPAKIETPAEAVADAEGVERKPKLVWNTPRERKPTTEEKKQEIESRRTWVDDAFSVSDRSSGEKASKVGIVAFIQNSHEKREPEGEYASLADDPNERMLARYAIEDVSLQDLFEEAQTPQDLHAIRSMGRDLLRPYITADGQKPWKNCSPQEKQFIRLGELILFESERRELEMSLGTPKGPDPTRAQKLYNSYLAYIGNADVPPLLQQRLLGTMGELQRHIKLAPAPERVSPKKPEAAQTAPAPQPKQPDIRRPQEAQAAKLVEIPASPEEPPTGMIHVPSPDTLAFRGGPDASAQDTEAKQQHSQAAYEGWLREYSVDGLNNRSPEELAAIKRQMAEKVKLLKERDADVAAESQDIYEGEAGNFAEYSAEVIDKLREIRDCDKPEDNVYRDRFLDSLPFQMTYAAYQNSEAPLYSRLIRGVIDKYDARWQVFGWRGIFKPSWAEKKMQEMRYEVAASWIALSGSETFVPKDSASAHALELTMANINEIENSRRAAPQTPVAPTPEARPPRLGISAVEEPIKDAIFEPDQEEVATSSVEQTNEQVARDARQKRQEARDRDVAARRAEIQRDPELVRLQSGIRTWLFNGTSRDFSSWKIGHVDGVAAFRRMAEFLRQPEEKVWEDIVDQFDDDQAGSVAA